MRNLSTKEQAKDTGLALILILLLFVQIGKYEFLVLPAIIVLVATMTWPAIFKPLARLWFGLSHILGTVVSKIILTCIFFLIVTPIGLIRKIWGADSMRLRLWGKKNESIFLKRDHTYSAQDLKNPY